MQLLMSMKSENGEFLRINRYETKQRVPPAVRGTRSQSMSEFDRLHALHVEVLRLRVVDDQGVGALFRHEHEVLAERDTDRVGRE